MNLLQIDKLINGKVGVGEMAKKSNSPFTEDWLPVRSIQNNMIITTNNYKVGGVKVTPRNIFILDYDMQNNILTALRNFYNTIDYEFWLISADRPVDLSVYMSQMQQLLNDTSSPAVRKLILQDIQKGEKFIDGNVVDTEYYLIFKTKDVDLFQKRVRQMITGLATCGLNAVMISNSDLRLILENFLNGGNTNEFGTVMIQ